MEHQQQVQFCVRVLDSTVNERSADAITRKNKSSLDIFTTSGQGKYEKRYIKITSTNPFKFPTIIPPSAPCDLVFTSETVDDSINVPASMMFSIDLVQGYDCRLNVILMYCGNLTGGRDIPLCTKSILLSEVLAESSSATTVKVFHTLMVSEYFMAPRLELEIVPAFTSTFSNTYLRLKAPEYFPRNPLTQKYVFYCEDANNEPVVDVEEFAWEPRLTFKPSSLYLESVLNSLLDSHRAWVERRQLETMRQGFFDSVESAMACGWYQLSVTVPSLKLSSPLTSNNKISNRTSSAPKFTYLQPIFVDDYPYHSTKSTDNVAVSSTGNRLKPNGSNLLSRGLELLSVGSKVDQANLDEKRTFGKTGRRLIDDRLPCTYVEIYAEDSEQSFLTFIGRTNTEVYTMHPVFGSNLNAAYKQSCATEASTMEPTKLIKNSITCDFNVFESQEELFIPNQKSSPVDSSTTLGTETSFCRYIPPTTSNITFDVYEFQGSKSSRKIASHKVSVSDIVSSSGAPTWATAEFSTSQRSISTSQSISQMQYSEVLIQYVATIKSNLGVNSNSQVSKKHAPQAMPLTLVVPRFSNGESASSGQISVDDETGFKPDYKELISSSQNWLWHLGMTGLDPLCFELNLAFVNDQPSKHLNDIPLVRDCDFFADIESNQQCVPMTVKTVKPFATADLLGLEEDGLLAPSTVAAHAVVSPVVAYQFVCPRVDYPYPIRWLDSHIEELEKIIQSVSNTLIEADEFSSSPDSDITKSCRSGRHFRPSVLKKESYAQPFAKNLHVQGLIVRRHNYSNLDILDSITSGCLSPHSLSTNKGGLTVMESELQQHKYRLNNLKSSFLALMGQSTLSSTRSFYPNDSSAEWRALQEIGNQTLLFESSLIQLGMRKIYPTAQALSIAINAFLVKLALVIDDKIPAQAAENWLSTGFLLVFECLLSLMAKERVMIEDSVSTVDTLKLYKIRILQSNPTDSVTELQRSSRLSVREIFRKNLNKDMSHATRGSIIRERVNTLLNRTINLTKLSPLESAKVSSNIKSNHLLGTKNQISVYGLDPSCADISIRGREIWLYLPSGLFTKLPPIYAQKANNGGAVIDLVPILFTQGIDLHQTVASMSSDIISLQHNININAFQQLNQYCHNYLSISNPTDRAQLTQSMSLTYASLFPNFDISNKLTTTASGIALDTHPILSSLGESLQNNDKKSKNVDMLGELERACLILYGCRVTFCKSGKDRTGMAVTLFQSRQLGEQYNCGMSEKRILRDANCMRAHGVRLSICEKNIGRRVYSFNVLQVQFLPPMYRPPLSVCESLLKKDIS